MNEQITKALHTAQFLSQELQEAASAADPVAFLLLEQFIRDAVSLEQRIKTLADRLEMRDGGQQ